MENLYRAELIYCASHRTYQLEGVYDTLSRTISVFTGKYQQDMASQCQPYHVDVIDCKTGKQALRIKWHSVGDNKWMPVVWKYVYDDVGFRIYELKQNSEGEFVAEGVTVRL